MVITQKCVVKGSILNAVQFRNIFVADVDLVSGDTWYDTWVPYLSGIYTPLLTYLSSAWNIDSYDLYSWVAGKWEFIETRGIVLTGGASGDPLPNQVAAVLIGKVPARRHMGRKFISGFTESYSLGNSPTTALLADLADAAVAWITPHTSVMGSVLQPGVISVGGTFRAFNSGVVSALWGSMRRRKPGLGI